VVKLFLGFIRHSRAVKSCFHSPAEKLSQVLEESRIKLIGNLFEGEKMFMIVHCSSLLSITLLRQGSFQKIEE